MNSDQHLNGLKNLMDATSIKAMDAIMIPAANELLATVKNRIMVEGKKSDSSQIGSYSTKPMYASKEQFFQKSAFVPRGKNSNRKNKTMYLPQGYKELRDIQGRPIDKMNLNYSGDTMLSYQQAKENDTTIVQGMVNERASKIRKGHEQKRGIIYSPTKQELEDYKKNIAADVATLIKKLQNA